MTAADFGLLMLRATVGLTVMAHGFNKLFGGGRLPGTARWFESMGLRNGWLQARMACTTELIAVAAASIAATGPGQASLDHAFGWDDRNGWTSLALAAGIGVGAALLQVAIFWRNPRKVASAS